MRATKNPLTRLIFWCILRYTQNPHMTHVANAHGPPMRMGKGMHPPRTARSESQANMESWMSIDDEHRPRRRLWLCPARFLGLGQPPLR